ncbi:hypothetical protein [Streptomyces chartreusis]
MSITGRLSIARWSCSRSRSNSATSADKPSCPALITGLPLSPPGRAA